MSTSESPGLGVCALAGSAEQPRIGLRFNSAGHLVEQDFDMRSLGELVVFARATGCSWTAVRGLLMRVTNKGITSAELDELFRAFSHLSGATALRTLEYYRLRETAAGFAEAGPFPDRTA